MNIYYYERIPLLKSISMKRYIYEYSRLWKHSITNINDYERIPPIKISNGENIGLRTFTIMKQYHYENLQWLKIHKS